MENEGFIRLNITEGFTCEGGNSYFYRPHFHITEEDYTFDSRGVVGYSIMKDVPIYKKVETEVEIISFWRNIKETKTEWVFSRTKDLYKYYRLNLEGTFERMNVFVTDKLIELPKGE